MNQFDWGYLIGSLTTGIIGLIAFIIYFLEEKDD